MVRVTGRWSWNHKSTGGGGEVERQTSRGEDLRKDDVADGGKVAEKPSCEIWSTKQKKRMKGVEGRERVGESESKSEQGKRQGR